MKKTTKEKKEIKKTRNEELKKDKIKPKIKALHNPSKDLPKEITSVLKKIDKLKIKHKDLVAFFQEIINNNELKTLPVKYQLLAEKLISFGYLEGKENDSVDRKLGTGDVDPDDIDEDDIEEVEEPEEEV